MVQPISFKRHRFPPDVIRQAVWLYFRFTLSIRDVEELLAQRGIEVSREAIRCWVNKFGPLIAANLRQRRTAPTGRWHLDEMVVYPGLRIRFWSRLGWLGCRGLRCRAQPCELANIEAQLFAELFVKFAQSLMWAETWAAMKPIE